MIGIVSCGAYIPYYRLKKETMAQAFGKGAGKGEKAVAYWDEDSITMAVAAASRAAPWRKDCFFGVSDIAFSLPYFASPANRRGMAYSVSSCTTALRSMVGNWPF